MTNVDRVRLEARRRGASVETEPKPSFCLHGANTEEYREIVELLGIIKVNFTISKEKDISKPPVLAITRKVNGKSATVYLHGLKEVKHWVTGYPIKNKK